MTENGTVNLDIGTTHFLRRYAIKIDMMLFVNNMYSE